VPSRTPAEVAGNEASPTPPTTAQDWAAPATVGSGVERILDADQAAPTAAGVAPTMLARFSGVKNSHG
jgi:hypothetical protein